MSYVGNYPPSTPLASNQIGTGVVSPSALTTGGPSWDSSGNLSTAGLVVMPSSFLRNRIINGDMRIDQRNAGAQITAANLTSGTYMVDRFYYGAAQTSKFTAQQNAGSVTPPVGFTNYLGMTVASAYSVVASDYFFVAQRIEGFNVADLAWGTANAKTVTLSFQVYSSLTGTFGGSIYNQAGTYSYPFSYTISSANTWTAITVIIPGSTNGVWLTTNGFGMQITFGLGAGSTYTAPANAWVAGLYTQANSTVSVVGTSGATFYITGVQLEVGTVATPFERRQYTTELQLCQRYYLQWTGSAVSNGFPAIGSGYAASTSQLVIFIPTPVQMRTSSTQPAASFSGTLTGTASGSIAANISSLGTFYINGPNGIWGLFNQAGNTWGIGTGALVYLLNASSSIFALNSEL